MIKKACAVAILATLFFSCKKSARNDVPVSSMKYTSLGDRVVKQGSGLVGVDIDEDNQIDIRFNTFLSGDPLIRTDKLIFFATPVRTAELLYPTNSTETNRFNLGDPIFINDFNDNSWGGLSYAGLMEKWEDYNGTVTWHGKWVNANKKYLPFAVTTNSQKYLGWIELSTNANTSELVLHRFAVSKKPTANIIAGK